MLSKDVKSSPVQDDLSTLSAGASTWTKIRVRSKSGISEFARGAILKRLASEPLNSKQEQAVQHLDGPMLVLAGAGSGKTRVVTCRMAKLIAAGVRPRRILAVTFTNKAADEMGERVNLLLGSDVRSRPTISTLHSLGVDILREHADKLGYSTRFKVVTDAYQEEYVELAMRKLDNDSLAELGKKPIEKLQSKFSDWKNNLVSPQSAEGSFAPAYAEYQKLLWQSGALDCDDLVRLAHELLANPDLKDEVLTRWQRKFDFILVDEYQDTNKAQFELLKLLAGSHENIFVVGDDDQSIYGWRGADVSLIRDFEQHWESAEVVKLETNYRSTQPILNLSNQLMTHDVERHQKTLRAHKIGGDQPIVKSHEDEHEEADWISDTIMGSGLPYGCFAVIIRTQFKMDPIVDSFKAKDIPYELWTKDTLRLGEEKRDILALLNCVDDPTESDMALIRLLRFPRFQLKDSEFEKLMDSWEDQGVPLWQVLDEGKQQVSRAAQGSIARVQKLVSKYHKRHDIIARKDSLSSIARDAILELFPSIRADYINAAGAPHVIETWVGRQLEYVDSFELNTQRPGFRKFLGHQEHIRQLAKQPPKRTISDDLDRLSQEPVIISTIHAVKGLEFPHVFLPCLEEGILPSEQSLKSDDLQALEEERRLAYVAMTRAKEQLYLSYARFRSFRGRSKLREMSRYINESGAIKLLDAEPGSDKKQQGQLF